MMEADREEEAEEDKDEENILSRSCQFIQTNKRFTRYITESVDPAYLLSISVFKELQNTQLSAVNASRGDDIGGLFSSGEHSTHAFWGCVGFISTFPFPCWARKRRLRSRGRGALVVRSNPLIQGPNKEHCPCFQMPQPFPWNINWIEAKFVIGEDLELTSVLIVIYFRRACSFTDSYYFPDEKWRKRTLIEFAAVLSTSFHGQGRYTRTLTHALW